MASYDQAFLLPHNTHYGSDNATTIEQLAEKVNYLEGRLNVQSSLINNMLVEIEMLKKHDNMHPHIEDVACTNEQHHHKTKTHVLWSRFKSLFTKTNETVVHVNDHHDHDDDELLRINAVVQVVANDPPTPTLESDDQLLDIADSEETLQSVVETEPSEEVPRDNGLSIIPPDELRQRYEKVLEQRATERRDTKYVGYNTTATNFSEFRKERNELVQEKFEEMKVEKGY